MLEENLGGSVVEIEGLQVWALLEALNCVLEQDTFPQLSTGKPTKTLPEMTGKLLTWR